MTRIFITGDVHGEIDIHKLNKKYFPEGQSLTKEDFVIICGDFGLVWTDPPSKTDLWWLDWLTKQPWTTLFVDGNHENHRLLNAYQIEEWQGGRVHKISDSIIHLMRGEIYEIGGYSVFAFGGGFSHDVHRRVENKSWWQEEMPDKYQISNALNNLEKHHYEVDIILTHDALKRIHDFLGYHRMSMKLYDTKYENLGNFLDYVDENTKYKVWFLGHYHMNKNIMKHYQFLYNDIVEVTPDYLHEISCYR